MDLFLNFGFAWISVLLTVMLSIIFIIRIAMKRSGICKNMFSSMNRALRKYHRQIGVVLVITGFVHGYFSSESVWSFNPGTISWILSILLGLNWILRKHFSKAHGWMYYHRILTVAFISAIVLHVLDVGIQAPQLLMSSPEPIPHVTTDKDSGTAGMDNSTTDTDNGTANSDSNTAGTDSDTASIDSGTIDSLNKQVEDVELKDGVFEGEATGFRDGLKVSVEIKNNAITSIQVIDHNEVNSRFYSRPIEELPQAIIDSQSLDVDTVSGATFTSVGIINAVNDALSKALISGDLPEMKQLPQGRGGRRH